MEIKLPIVFEANDYHAFENYKELLNKVIKLKDDEKHLKEAVDFIEIGCNGQYYAFFYDNSFKLDNNQIVETLLESNRGDFKSIQDIQDYLDNFVDTDILKNINLNLIIKNLEQETPFLKISKKKKTI